MRQALNDTGRSPLRSLPVTIGQPAPGNIPPLENGAFSKSGIHLQVASPGGNKYKVRPDEDGVVSSSFVKRYIATHQEADIEEDDQEPRPSVMQRNSKRTFMSLAQTITTGVVEKNSEPFVEVQRFRLNTSGKRTFAEYFVSFNVGVKRIGSSWRRFSEFKALAKDISKDRYNFSRAHKAWERVVKQQKWTRCLDRSYLRQKKSTLDGFVAAVIEDSESHRKGMGLLQKFVCDDSSPASSMPLHQSGNS
jgi:hypothetical protein